jgi:hypothetical protein
LDGNLAGGIVNKLKITWKGYFKRDVGGSGGITWSDLLSGAFRCWVRTLKAQGLVREKWLLQSANVGPNVRYVRSLVFQRIAKIITRTIVQIMAL